MSARILTRIFWALAALVPLAFLAVFFAWPVLAMLARGFFADGSLNFSAFAEVLGSGRTWRIAWQTIWMALAGTAGSVVLGIPAAYVLYCCRFPGRRLLRAIATVPFVLPTVVVGAAFRALLGKGGLYSFAGLDGTPNAVVLALVFFNLSVVIRTVGTMWLSLDPRTAEAARTLGARPWRVLRTVTLPTLGPSIAASGGLVFLFCATAYGVVQTLGRPGYGTLETEIWVQTSTYLDLRTAAVFSCLQLTVVVLSLLISRRMSRGTDVALRLRSGSEHRLRRPDLPALVVTLVVIAALLVAPMASLVVRSLRRDGQWSVENYRLLSTSGSGFTGGATVLDALSHSVRIAVDATCIALAVGIPLALVLSRRVRSRRLARAQALLDSAVMLPLGVSAVTVGFGFFISLQGPPLNLAGNGMLVPLAQAVVALPLVVRVLVPVLRAIDPRLREAAATLGAGPGRVLATVDFPFMIRGLGLATGFAFAISLGEFGATSFLASADYMTLPVLIARLLGRAGANNYGMAMAASVILAVVTAGVMALCENLRPRGIERRSAHGF
ncbi:iron ABC transporter permease [Actinobaculum sp. 352]|uniref:ABC transporter permease n=1 Tax=Actinobaculum sp. 352 TaxID=2490946 RepID=UPI000F7F032B|nr:iron ABC transporter permease [Actinobaculum sp. 352]RTE48258.1 iron ABC transporter permease [Actinobaculum sp. 352]